MKKSRALMPRSLKTVRRRRVERGGGHAGFAKPEQVMGKTGLQVMTALLEGDIPHSTRPGPVPSNHLQRRGKSVAHFVYRLQWQLIA